MAEPDFDNECFLISPIGKDGSETRKRANGVMRAIVEPAAEAHGLEVVRADQVSEPGTITLQIVEHLTEARAVVADLTGENPNVYYELAIREAAQKPVVLIADNGTDIPFDKAQDRVLFFDSTDLASVWEAHVELVEFLRASLEGKLINPIASAMVWKEYAASSEPVERALAQLADQVSRLAADMHSVKRETAYDAALRARLATGPTTFSQTTGGAIDPSTYVVNTPVSEKFAYPEDIPQVDLDASRFQFMRDTPPPPPAPTEEAAAEGEDEQG